jgi:hypothetical protein
MASCRRNLPTNVGMLNSMRHVKKIWSGMDGSVGIPCEGIPH